MLLNKGDINNMAWRNRPRSIDYCPNESEYIMFVDENGDNDLKYIKKCLANNSSPDINNVFFTVTGCIIHKEHLKNLIEDITILKNKYWESGLYTYKNKTKRVCLHSRDIRKKDGPFLLDKNTYSNFMNDLTNFLESIDTKIISININKEKLCRKYNDPFDPYEISSEFLIERYVKFLLENNTQGIIMLEARGSKEDRMLLQHLKGVIKLGTGNSDRKYVKSTDFIKSIKGIYFNPKWAPRYDLKKSYFGLEITDLFSHPIHNYVRSSYTVKNRPYEVLESKLMNYPHHLGFGLKTFP